ncbi:carbamoyltransferase HypF [Enterovibrio sp. ZSDZ35]|uniref:Carbamoyltransferase HypF n=1 Tax=Enterovibrio qingdaonensis TaxID=2899818 RepID=A0ABT5QI81_9GAMM|nr:carbamoyltransferase HypF [Enterovibrio sp. ZSDZ35]MDD1780700.1 carbamoyltransferase HypF [Enterovibrio sp. ZSDZ35]
MIGFRYRIRGVVQGVGFRPTVWRVAQQLELKGHVFNDGEGVIVELWCDLPLATRFIDTIHQECPPLASISAVETKTLDLGPCPDGFTIAESDETEAINAGIPVDAVVCSECAEETLDPNSRRYRYPFTNCTHCGPRLTIISALPYDRPKTSMATFPLCEQCEREYLNPANRRFHAQPIACPECGPRVWLSNADGDEVTSNGVDSLDVIQRAARYIQQGKIVAVKGLGGFHLVCDATNEHAVTTLRNRKLRPHKPFAVMMKDSEQVLRYCEPSQMAIDALKKASSPVVIMPQRDVTVSHCGIGLREIVPSVAPNLRELGVMLPTTPLHLLLCRDVDVPLVMTSANRSGNPQCFDNQEAINELSGIADIWLLHDRDIVIRADDSVLKQTALGMQVLRRARGLAPSPISLPKGFEQTTQVLALGGEVKNAFCLLSKHGAILSQYIGDLESLRVWEDFQRILHHYQSLYRFTPERVAVDCHPEYIATKFAKNTYPSETQINVQHHHAHVAACMGDNQLPIDHDAVLGVVLDGLGFGVDGSLWGGEFLLADYRGFTRVGHFSEAALPGGSKAITQPWRNLIARLKSITLEPHEKEALFTALGLDRDAIKTIDSMIVHNTNSPLSSSAGRLFDAVSALLSVCVYEQSYEGQAAIELEALANLGMSDPTDRYPFFIEDGEPAKLNPSPMWPRLMADMQNGVEASTIARKFHLSVADAICQMVLHLFDTHTIWPKVALSGGVFQNRILLEATVQRLKQHRIEVIIHQQIPANDGGLAFGQALVAAAVSLSGNTQVVRGP